MSRSKKAESFGKPDIAIHRNGRYFKKLRALLNQVIAKKDAEPHEYAILYYQIPEEEKSMRSVFYRRIIRKAKSECWPRDQVAATLSLIH